MIANSTPLNFKKQLVQPERYLPKKYSNNAPLPPRVRKGSKHELARNAVNQGKTNVTK